MGKPEEVARKFHEAYERLAPKFGYETRKESAVPWEKVPENNRQLMIAVCDEVLAAILRENGMGGVPLCEKCGKYPPIERSALCLHCHPRYSDPGESSPSPSGAKTCRDTRLEMAFRWADENLGGLTMKEIVPILWRNRNTMAIRELVDAAREAKSR